MPAIDTRSYRTFLSRRFSDTIVNKETYEALVTTFQSFLANTATSSQVSALIAQLSAGSSYLYLGIGRSTEWTNDNNPPTPNTSTQALDFAVWRDLLAVKRIDAANTSVVIPRRDWANNTLYTQYDDTVANITSSNLYVLDTQTLPYRVYKCLWNNRGANSTVAPSTTGNTVTPVATADGYVWQYMYTVTFDDYQFLTDKWMPVKTDPLVRTSAQTTYGHLSTIVPLVMTANGGGFNPNGTFTVTLTGDGNGAVIAANTTSLTFASNTITNITFANGGVGYTTVNTVVVQQAGASNATARAIIPTYPNHGFDPETELGSAALMLTLTLEDDELNKLTTTNEYRRILLLDNPQLANGALANGGFYRQTYDLYFASNTGPFSPDDTIAVSNNTEFAVTATVVDTILVDSTVVVRVTNVNDKGRCACVTGDNAFEPGDEITNLTVEGSTAVLDSVTPPELLPFSGDVLYVDQREPVTRAAQQSEEIKLVFRFD